MLLKYIMSGSSAIFKGVVAVLESWHSSPWPSDVQSSMMCYVATSLPPRSQIASLFSILFSSASPHFWLVVVSAIAIGGRPSRALLMEYFFHANHHGRLLGYTTHPPCSIQMAPAVGGVANDPVNACRWAEWVWMAHRWRQSIVAWALLMEYFYQQNRHGRFLGYTLPPCSIQIVPVVGGVANDPVNARRQAKRVRTFKRQQ